MEITIHEIKINLAIGYLNQYADPQEARHAADQNGEIIDSSQWKEAENRMQNKTRG